MNEDALNTTVRKFLKKVGVTAQPLPAVRHGWHPASIQSSTT